MRHSKLKTIIAVIAIPVLFYVLFLFTNPLYDNVDNIEVAAVVGGIYGKNNFCQFLHPLFCLLIRPLNYLLPAADVFTTIVHVVILFSLSLITWLGTESIHGKTLRDWTIKDYLLVALILLSLAFISAGVVIWNVNYTTQTAFFIFSGLITLSASAQRRKGLFWLVSGTALIGFGFMLRMEAALLFLPFIVLKTVTDIIEARERSSKVQVLRHILPSALIIVLLISSRAAFYHLEPYQTAMRYNKARTTCVDFPMRGWQEDSGILSADYRAATAWVLADTEILDANLLESIAEKGSRDKFSLKTDGITPVLKEMWRRLSQTNLYLLSLFILTGILFLWNIVQVRSPWKKIESILAVLGGFIILFYFTLRGRALLHVWEPVLFAADFVLISAVISEERQHTVDQIFRLLLCVVLWFSAGQVIAHNEFRQPATPLNAKTGADDSAYAETYESDNVYLWSAWMSAVPRYFMSIDKLPTQRVLEHNIPIGDWTYGQPYFNDYLKRIGIPNPAKALVEQENVYVMSDSNILLKFLKVHYDEIIEFEKKGEINGKPVYQVVRERQ